MNSHQEITKTDLHKLVQYFAKTSYKTRYGDSTVEDIQERCIHLFSRDYKCSIISNTNGHLCGHYPSKIIIPESKLVNGAPEKDGIKLNDPVKLKELFNKARFARCRSRFVVPVILYEDKNICRSATLSSGAEIYGRSSYDLLFAGGGGIPNENLKSKENCENKPYTSSEWDLLNRVRGQDILLLKTLKVHFICDLMVEKKKVKFGMSVTSSEKVDKEGRYSDFCLCSLPYPGCEFFKDFKETSYTAEDMFFDWNQAYVDAKLSIDEDLSNQLGVNWNQYQSWDLITLTQNYLRLIIRALNEGDDGILVHCISGWDRTPLFVSLLRISLWADGKAHSSLNPAEILYLTIAYDWLLFGHDLEDRLLKGEEVFFFCFNFLKHIVPDEFSTNQDRRNSFSLVNSEVKSCDSISQLDSTILLVEEKVSRGSNTSLNSCSSVTSEHRLSYFIGQEIAEDDESLHSSVSTVTSGISIPGTNSPGLRAHPYCLLNSDSDNQYNSKSTSPLPVPHRPRKNSNNSDQKSSGSSVCGSWQIISDSGSPRGTTTVRDSPLSLTRGSSCTSLSEGIEESQRQQRLESVRNLFHLVYHSAVSFQSESSTFGSILDHVTETFRGGWSTTV